MLAFSMTTIMLYLFNHINGDISGNEDTEFIKKIIKENFTSVHFPPKYLDSTVWIPTDYDFEYYINALKRNVLYFEREPNTTDSNTALCLFFTKSILKRTVLNHGQTIKRGHLEEFSNIIKMIENILSHYVYKNSFYGWSDTEFRVSKLLQSDDSLVHSIGEINQNRLTKWIYNNIEINEYIKQIDDASLPKEKYAQILEDDKYYIGISDSDYCLSQVAYNPEPIELHKTRRCKSDAYCNLRLYATPSIAYGLSHRLLIFLFRLNMRRCYTVSEEEDITQMDKMCAFMYREAVYIARRGFFARDMFLEHVALCALMGYKEYYRRNWFHKASTWLNAEGCMKEFHNFNINRSQVVLNVNTNRNMEYRSKLVRWRCNLLHSICDDHPSALLTIVISHAIRYIAHFM